MTRLRITRPTFTAPGAPLGAARAEWSSPSSSLIRCRACAGCSARSASTNRSRLPTLKRCGTFPTYPPRPILSQLPRRTRSGFVRLGTYPALPRRPTKITAAAPHQAGTRVARRPGTVRKRTRHMTVADHGDGTRRPTGPHARAVVRRTSGTVGRISYPALPDSSAIGNRQR